MPGAAKIFPQTADVLKLIFDFLNEEKYLNVAPTPEQFQQRQDAKWAHFDLIGQILCFPL